MTDELLSRLGAVRKQVSNALLIGGDAEAIAPEMATRGIVLMVADPGFGAARLAGGVQCDEDRMPFADASFDLVMAIGTLDTVNDLPGALTLIRRILRPDGVFLGAMVGAGSLPALRRALAVNPGIARIHPQIDVRGAGDLLGRAGFVLPVADTEIVNVRYGGIGRLSADLRANGLSNVLAGRRPLSGTEFSAAKDVFEGAATDGKTMEQIALIFLTGWAPSRG